ncbi:MAG: YCF48-related protein [bacterium]|nr:YCF48-related protein [bacterium]
MAKVEDPALAVAGIHLPNFLITGDVMRKFCLIIAGLFIFTKLTFAGWVTQYSSGYVYDISFPDSLHGWAALGTTTNLKGRVLSTKDGGKIWTEKIIGNTLDTVKLTNICFADSLKGWAGGSLGSYFSSKYLNTTNGFNTWAYGVKGCKFSCFQGYSSLIEMTLVSGKLFYRYGWTDSGGNTAFIVGNGLYCEMSGLSTAMCFTDLLHGWAIFSYYGGTRLFYRTVSGVKDLSFLYTFQNIINDIDFVDSLHGWAVGDTGKILYTDNGGNDSIWEPLTSGVTNNLTCVKFVDQLNGWAGGNGVILRTRNSGTTWEVEATTSDTVTKICAIDTTYAWALASGKIMKYQPYVGVEEKLNIKNQNAKMEIIKDKICLSVPNNEYTNIRLTIYDLCGRLQSTVYSGTLTKGNYTFTPNIKTNGIYFVTLTTGNIKTTKKLILMK